MLTYLSPTPSRPARRRWPVAIRHAAWLAALALALAGCGMRLAYTNLDRLIPWVVSDYVTLDDTQREMLDGILAVRLAWHCSTQLPAYRDWLQRVAQVATAPAADAAQLQALGDEAEGFMRTLGATLAPDLVPLLASLSDAQTAELLEAFAERIEDDRETYLDPPAERRRAQRIERMEERLEKWLGELSREQEAAVARWADALRPTTATWLAQREAWRQRLGAALTLRGDSARFAPLLRALLVEPEHGWPHTYRDDLAFNRARTFTLLSEVQALASARQRAHIADELAALAEPFTGLACAAPPAQRAEALSTGVATAWR